MRDNNNESGGEFYLRGAASSLHSIFMAFRLCKAAASTGAGNIRSVERFGRKWMPASPWKARQGKEIYSLYDST